MLFGTEKEKGPPLGTLCLFGAPGEIDSGLWPSPLRGALRASVGKLRIPRFELPTARFVVRSLNCNLLLSKKVCGAPVA